MLPRPRVVAIDNDPDDLNAIADALNGAGTACLKLLYEGGLQEGTILEQVRVIFIDLHLSHPSGMNNQLHFGAIGALLKEYVAINNGPFILIVWTLYPTQVEGLNMYLCERLVNDPHAIPTRIETLSKIEHIRDKKVIDPSKLIADVKSTVKSLAPIAALVNWENRVTTAASETIAAVVGLVPNDKRDPANLEPELQRLLNALATEAVGSSNVSKDRFAAVNEALLPILYDRVSRLKVQRADEKLWDKAIAKPGQKSNISSVEAAQLNSMLHIDFDVRNASTMDRGVVLECPESLVVDDEFRRVFGMSSNRFVTDQLGFDPAPDGVEIRWVMIQVEGVCDYAQAQAGPAPYLIGIEGPPASPPKPPQAVWQSPTFWVDSRERAVYLNFRFGQSFSNTTSKGLKVLYRFREALTNDLVSRLHSYGARPGIISFRNAFPKSETVGTVLAAELVNPESVGQVADASVIVPQEAVSSEAPLETLTFGNSQSVGQVVDPAVPAVKDEAPPITLGGSIGADNSQAASRSADAVEQVFKEDPPIAPLPGNGEGERNGV